MSLWVVVGGQFGSEGKGKIAAHVAREENIDICVRCGGPNSGHSVTGETGTVVLRQLPTGYLNRKTRLLIPAGALVDLAILKHEIDLFKIDVARVGVDRNAMIIEQHDRDAEQRLGLNQRVSSTLSGVGAAISRRVLREPNVLLAREAAAKNPWLRNLITNASLEINGELMKGKKVLVEGTQGFGLSLYHSEFFPKCTSRDTTAAGFLSEVGLSPFCATEIVVVFRTFPIRVHGEQAGPLQGEITWELLQKESKYPHPIAEYTSVTNKLRRVGRFDWDLARAATLTNRPTRIAITGLDYIDYANYGKRSFADLTLEAQAFLRILTSATATKISYCSSSPALSDVFEVPTSKIRDEQPWPYHEFSIPSGTRNL